jgi:hypothetical protein
MRAPIQLRIDADDGVIAPREMPWVHWHGRESGVAPLSPLSRPERQKNNRPGGSGQSGEAYEVLSQDSGRAVGYIRPRICTFVEE